jgi:S1-C subfamily serine protease
MPAQSTHLLSQISTEVAELVAQASLSTVSVQSGDRSCSAFLLQPNVVVTASDPIEAEADTPISIETKAGRLQSRLIGRDAATDIAVLKVDGAVGGPLHLAADAQVVAGQTAIVVGQSQFGVSCSVGFVSLAGSAWESMRGGKIDRRIRLDIRLDAHQEGGPVLNPEGQCIGMAVFGPRRRALVIPAATVERVASELLTHGRIKRGYLGVTVQPVRLQPQPAPQPEEGRVGVMVVSLDPSGPAQQAGILQGDVITALDGITVSTARQLHRLLGPETAGRNIQCELFRAGKYQILNLTIGERPVR